MSNRYLAAVHFGDGQDIDALLAQFVSDRTSRGVRVTGILQSRGDGVGECFCSDMDLSVIATDRVFRISQPLGSGSSGCRLHPGALAECSAFLREKLNEGTDLLVLNRFGKGESEGRGFRDLISFALSNEIPVLIAVRQTYLTAWELFSGDYGIKLPFDLSAVETWFGKLEQADAA